MRIYSIGLFSGIEEVFVNWKNDLEFSVLDISTLYLTSSRLHLFITTFCTAVRQPTTNSSNTIDFNLELALEISSTTVDVSII